MRCGLKACWAQDIVGYVHDLKRDPDRVVMIPLCAGDMKAAATVGDYQVHLFRKHRAPEGYK